MKVSELIRILQGCNPNDIVKMSDDCGNYYLDIAAVETDTAYNESTQETKYRKLTAEMRTDGYTYEDIAKGKGFKKTVTLYA